MSLHSTPANQRRAERKHTPQNAVVIDVISDQQMGHLGNLSRTGMLLISDHAPRSEAIYQVSVPLPATGRNLLQSQPIQVGIQEQWHEQAASSGQIWAGYRIIAISDTDSARLDSWLAEA
ncbi:MAG: PilZ domain-containing protein [Rhodanobacter sp.]